jgi:hypothetical protein
VVNKKGDVDASPVKFKAYFTDYQQKF